MSSAITRHGLAHKSVCGFSVKFNRNYKTIVSICDSVATEKKSYPLYMQLQCVHVKFNDVTPTVLYQFR